MVIRFLITELLVYSMKNIHCSEYCAERISNQWNLAGDFNGMVLDDKKEGITVTVLTKSKTHSRQAAEYSTEGIMKKCIIILFTMFFISSYSIAQWELLNEGFYIQSVQFVNDQTGWLTGYNSTILKTTDAGQNWETISISDQMGIHYFDFVNESLGWATGSGDNQAIILKSTNGGNDWTVKYKSPNIWFGIIYGIDDKNALATASNKVLKTTDGGTSWKDISYDTSGIYYYGSIWFPNPDTGIIAGSYFDGITQRAAIFRTDNGGTTWDTTIIKDFYNIFNFQIMNDSTAFFMAYIDTTYYVAMTTDMCKTWTIKKENGSLSWIDSYYFTDTSTGYVLNRENFNQSNISKTTDGGRTWQKYPSPNISRRLNYSQIYFNKNNQGLLVANMGCIFRSSDGGDWDLIKNGYSFEGAAFFDKNNGIIYGGFNAGLHETFPSGDMFATADGGKTFQPVYNALDIFKSSAVLSDSVILIAGKSIYKSTDRGNNWNIKFTAASDSVQPVWGMDLNTINDIHFTGKTGWAAGRDFDPEAKASRGIILNSSDRGETWKLVHEDKDSSTTFHYFNSIWSDSSEVWAVGTPGTVAHYTSSKGWIQNPSMSELPFNKVYSLENNVWISGGYSADRSLFLKSTNNGQSWKTFQNSNFQLNDFTFLNKDLGWAVGRDTNYESLILKTTNGGEKWEVVLDKIEGILQSITVKDNYAWAVGDRGLILKTTNAGLTWVDDNDNIYAMGYRLEQNFPNPFNPSTIITWNLPEASEVSLRVFDLLGKEVAVLVNGQLRAGEHRAVFNAGSLPSGVYFYKLDAGKHSLSRKMLLIR